MAELGFCGFGGSVSGAGVVAVVFGVGGLLWHCWVDVVGVEVDWWVGVVGVELEWEWEWEWGGWFHGFGEVVVSWIRGFQSIVLMAGVDGWMW